MIAKQSRYWIGIPPDKCDIGGEAIQDVFIDGRTIHNGVWGFMCPNCHESDGCGLGVGRGQRYEKQPDGKWLKTEG